MSEGNDFDLLIFGGGVAGVSAGIWADELGLSAAIVDQSSAVGGQLSNVYNEIKNFPGADFRNGSDMADGLAKQISNRRVHLFNGLSVVSADLKARRLVLDDGRSVSGDSLIIATGVRRKRLEVPGEEEFYGFGILSSGAKDPHVVSGKIVAIVGGGDAATENALILSRHAKTVLLIHRRSKLAARDEFVDKLGKASNIEVLLDSEVTGFGGSEVLSSIEIKNNLTNEVAVRTVDNALVRIGFAPNSDTVADQVDLDQNSYVIVDKLQRTNVKNVYAAGDICSPEFQTIGGAVGTAITAIASIFRSLND